MLAKAGGGGHNLRGILLKAVNKANALHGSEALIFPLNDVLAGSVLRILLDVCGAVAALVGNAGLVEDLFQLVAGMLRAELLAERLGSLSAGVKEGEAGALGRNVAGAGLGHTNDGIAALHRTLAHDGDKHGVAVLGVIEGEAAGLVALVAGAVRHGIAGLGIAGVEPSGGVVVQQAEHGIILGHIAGITLAGVFGVNVTGQSHNAGVVSGDKVGNIGVDLERRGCGAGAVHVHVAAHGLARDVVGSLVLGRAGLAVAGNMDDRQRLIVAPNHFIAQTALGIVAGSACLDPDVGPLDALEEYFLAAGGGGVERDGVLVAVVLGPGKGSAGLAGNIGSLSLKNLCAHLGHQAAGKGAGNVGAGNKDLDALEHAELGVFVELLGQLVLNFLYFHCELPFKLLGYCHLLFDGPVPDGQARISVNRQMLRLPWRPLRGRWAA